MPIDTHMDNLLWTPACGHELPPITLSQTNSIHNTGRVLQSNSQKSPDAWPYPSTQFSPSPMWPYSSFGSPPPFFYPPNLSPRQCFSSPDAASFSQSFPPSPSAPFSLCKLGGNISVCAGCRNKYSKSVGPPDDMCIKHQEWREYTSPGLQVPGRRYGNVYYHFDPKCVRHRCASFVPMQLEILPDIISQLGESHKEKLRTLFNINLS